MEPLSIEHIRDWVGRNCLSAFEIEKRNEIAVVTADNATAFVTDDTVSRIEELVFQDSQFGHNPAAFAYAMAKFGKKYSGDDDIEIRYLKKEGENGNIHPTFTVRNLALIRKRIEAEKEAQNAAKENKQH